jgi:hypothetical protein
MKPLLATLQTPKQVNSEGKLRPVRAAENNGHQPAGAELERDLIRYHMEFVPELRQIAAGTH